MRDVPVNKIREFEAEFTSQLQERHPETLAALKAGNLMTALPAYWKQWLKELSGKYK